MLAAFFAFEEVEVLMSLSAAKDAGRVDIGSYLRECRTLVLDEIRNIVPRDSRYSPILYDLVLDYPLRDAKALRPAICIATCQAFGGRLEAVLPTAAVLELYHNAFLIHDDVEDGSERRRDALTLHRKHGVPIAVNVGDAMLALALQPLLDNMGRVGMGKALRILRAVAQMAKESAEGQAIELHWVRNAIWSLPDDAYFEMVEKKTGWYSFITPMLVGTIIAGAPPQCVDKLVRFAKLLGAAFQIQDDVLNLRADESRYGKEIAGDLWEGKHTLILLHMLRSATASERRRVVQILQKTRPAAAPAGAANSGGPGASSGDAPLALRRLLHDLERTSEISAAARFRIDSALTRHLTVAGSELKTVKDIQFMRQRIDRHDSVRYAQDIASARAREAESELDALGEWIGPSVHRDFLGALVDFVVLRDK